jgi:thioredoxin 1
MRALIRSLFAAIALCVAGAVALAAEMPFDKAKFDAALAQGKPVVVDFAADWCPTCKAQKPVVQGLLTDPKRKDLIMYVANFDTESALKKQLGVTMQSTLVVFKGGKEVGRSTGQTDKAVLGELFDKAL